MLARRAIPAALAAFFALALTAAPAISAVPTFKGSSADGEVAFFETDEKLVPGDTDSKRDVYERSFDPLVGEAGAYVTREVSTGPSGGNDAYHAQFEAANAAGTRVFFSTEETLVAADTDRKLDLYARDLESGETALVSRSSDACAPACGNGPIDAGFAAADSSGNTAFFVTEESLVSSDADAAVDIYRRNLTTETTSLVSVAGASCSGSCGNGANNAVLRGLSADGSTAFFVTNEKLVTPADGDAATDVYARNLNALTTTLVSQPDSSCSGCGNTTAVPIFRSSSADGTRAFFTTDEKLVTGDSDAATDVYARDLPGGPTMLVSSGGTTNDTAVFAAADDTGATALFTTSEPLVGGDTNKASDVYRWTGGAPSLVTSGSCEQGEAKGCGSTFNAAVGSTAVVFTTTESLALSDNDSSADVYSQPTAGGSPTLLTHGDSACQPTCGNGETDAKFSAIAAGEERFFFTTNESLIAGDTDTTADIYLHDSSDSSVSLVSVSGFCPIPVKSGGCPADFRGVSSAGDHVFFNTSERLSLEENDSEVDIYERAFGASPGEDVTRLVSVGNSPDLELGPVAPVLEAMSPASPAASTTPSILGQAETNTSIKLYTEANCTGAVAKTGTAAELTGAGIQVSVSAGSTTTFWATSTDIHGDTSACSNSISYTQESPPPSGGGTGGSGSGGSAGGGGSVPVPPEPPRGPRYVTPLTRITFGPAFKTRERRPVFRFTDSTGQPDTRFFCKLDRKPWKPCGSPVRLKGLGRGRHIFSVKGMNGAGEWEARPATRRFKLVAPR